VGGGAPRYSSTRWTGSVRSSCAAVMHGIRNVVLPADNASPSLIRPDEESHVFTIDALIPRLNQASGRDAHLDILPESISAEETLRIFKVRDLASLVNRIWVFDAHATYLLRDAVRSAGANPIARRGSLEGFFQRHLYMPQQIAPVEDGEAKPGKSRPWMTW